LLPKNTFNIQKGFLGEALMKQDIPNLGVGLYTVADAARLLKINSRKIRRWLSGYEYQKNGNKKRIDSLWLPHFVMEDGKIELGFRDLMELRFIDAFLNVGLSLPVIRKCLLYAQELIGDDRPFLTRRFKTDGKTIFLNGAGQEDDNSLLDLKNRQYAIKEVIKATFRDLDIIDDKVVSWRPFHGKNTIIVDPQFVFGQPMTTKYHIPTITLFQAVKAEGSIKAASKVYEIPESYIRDSVSYEQLLAA